MKKLVRIMGLCALVALAFGSCKKNETKTFKASTVELQSDSKTEIFHDFSGYHLYWTSGDEITVFKNGTENLGETPRVFHAALTEKDSHGNEIPCPTANFHVYNADGDFMSDLNVANSYTAYYPNVTCTANEVRIPISAEQHRVANGGLNFVTNTYPMLAKNDDHATFAFSSDAGVLALRFVKATSLGDEDHVYIDSVTITAYKPTDYLAGEMVYDRANGSYQCFDGTNGSISICAVAQHDVEVTGDGVYWTFVLPKGALKDGFTMKAYWNGVEMVGNTGTNDSGVNEIQAQYVLLMPDVAVDLPTPPTPTAP